MTVGGAISGILRHRQREDSAIAPASMMTIDSTEAKIGRSMKKWERRMSGSGPR